MKNYTWHTIQTGQAIAAQGIPCTTVHSGDVSLVDSTIEIDNTPFHVQVCLHGDFALVKQEGDKLRYWDCPTLDILLTRMKDLL